MSKNVKLTYLLSFILTGIVIAWRSLSNFFGGVGINYVAILVIVGALVLLCLFDKPTFARTKDLFFVACAFAVLETIVYFPNEFGGCFNYDVAVVFLNFQNVYSFLAILYLAWLTFRFIAETKNVKIGFVEVMLGNSKKEKKVKKAKELSNGSLEEKPNAKEEIIIDEFSDETTENTDDEY